MISGKTSTGFEWQIEEAKLDNMELVDAIRESETNDLAFSDVVALLFDSKQRKALYDHVRLDNGTVPTKAIYDEIVDVFNSTAEIKNSES